MSPLFLLVSAPPTLNDTFNAAVRAQMSSKRFRAKSQLFGWGDGPKQNVSHELALDGKTFLFRVREAQTRGRAASDRSFLFRPTQAVGYDPKANERLTRNYPATFSYLDRMSYTVGLIDDDVRFMLRPLLLKNFLDGMASLSGWRISTGPRETVMLRVVDIGTIHSRTELRFSKASHLLTYVSIKSGAKVSGWSTTYLPATTPTLNIPASARLVPAFTVEPPPPVFINPTAKKVVDRLVHAYRNLRNATISVSDNNGKTLLAWSGDRIKEENATGAYLYRDGVLSIYNAKTRKFYSGRCSPYLMPDYVSEAGVRADILALQHVRGRVPFGSLLTADVRAKASGTVDGPTGRADVLELSGGSYRSTWMVRQRDGLIDALATNTLDNRGRPLMTTARRFTYGGRSVTWSLAKPAGVRTLPLIAPKRRK